MQCEECFDRSVRFFIHVVASLKGLFSFVVNIRCLDLICLIELLLSVHPLLVIDLPTCLLYFTILSHKPRVHLSKICHSLRSLWDWKAFQTCFDMIWLNYCALCILYWLSPLPTCLLYFTILAHKPSVRPSIVRFLVRRWVFVHGPLIERHLVQDCHIVKMVIEFRVFVFSLPSHFSGIRKLDFCIGIQFFPWHHTRTVCVQKLVGMTQLLQHQINCVQINLYVLLFLIDSL